MSWLQAQGQIAHLATMKNRLDDSMRDWQLESHLEASRVFAISLEHWSGLRPSVNSSGVTYNAFATSRAALSHPVRTPLVSVSAREFVVPHGDSELGLSQQSEAPGCLDGGECAGLHMAA